MKRGAGESVEQLGTLIELLTEMQSDATILEDRLTFCCKDECTLSYEPAVLLLGIYNRGMTAYIYRKTCTWMFVTGLFVIVPNWKQLSVLQLMNKLWYIHTAEYYLAIKRNELLINVTKL